MHHPHVPFFSPLFRFDVKPTGLPFFNNGTKDAAPLSPQDLTKPKNDAAKKGSDDEEEDQDEPSDVKSEPNSPKMAQEEEEPREEQEPKDEDKGSVKGENGEEVENEDDEEQPENLSSKSLPLMYPLPLVVRVIMINVALFSVFNPC